jgi:uncharacterized protein
MKNLFKRIFWDSTTRRLRTLWRLLLHLIMLALLSGIGFGLVSLAINAPRTTRVSPAILNALSTVTTLAAILLSVWLAGRYLDRRRFVDFGIHWRRDWWLDFAFGLSLGALLMFLIFLVELAAGWIKIVGAFRTASPNMPFGRAILEPVLLFICVGIYEEFFSRGYQLKNLAEGFNGLWGLGYRSAIILATLVSATIFGLLHAGNPNATWVSTFNIFLAGIFLAVGYLLTGELAIPIGLHMGWNFFQGNVFGFPVSGTDANATTFIAIQQGGNPLITGGAFGPEAGLIGIAALIVGSLLIVGWVRMHYGVVRLEPRVATPDLRFPKPNLDKPEPQL